MPPIGDLVAGSLSRRREKGVAARPLVAKLSASVLRLAAALLFLIPCVGPGGGVVATATNDLDFAPTGAAYRNPDSRLVGSSAAPHDDSLPLTNFDDSALCLNAQAAASPDQLVDSGRRWALLKSSHQSVTQGVSLRPADDLFAPNTRMSGSTTVGQPDHASSNMRKFSAKNPEPGYYDVVGHGSPHEIAGMSPAQLADRIRDASGGQNIRLLSCQAGCPTGNFAQELADNLGVRVMAPTTDIGASNTGKTLTIFDGGEWRWFDPN